MLNTLLHLLLLFFIPFFTFSQTNSQLSIIGNSDPNYDISTYHSFVFKDNLYLATVHTYPYNQFPIFSRLNSLGNDIENVFNFNLMRVAKHKDFLILSAFENNYETNLRIFLSTDGLKRTELNIHTKQIDQYLEVGDKLYFAGNGYIYVSDGTVTGTIFFTANNTDSYVNVQKFYALGDTVYFIATTYNGKWGLYKIIGNKFEYVLSDAYSAIVKDNSLYVASGTLPFYLTRIDKDHQSYFQFKSIKAKSGENIYSNWSYFSMFDIINDKLIVALRLPNMGEKLFVLNDEILEEFYALPSEFLDFVDAYFIGTINEKLIFQFKKSKNDYTSCLWVTDGTTEGTKILREDVRLGVNPGSSLYPTHSVVRLKYGNRLFFNGNSASTGIEIYYTDGTEEETKPLLEIVKGPASSYTADLVLFKGNFYFEAQSEFGVKKMFSYKINCHPEIKVTNGNLNSEIQSEARIISNQNIVSNFTTYKTNNSIILEPGFNISEGKVFETKLNQGCIF